MKRICKDSYYTVPPQKHYDMIVTTYSIQRGVNKAHSRKSKVFATWSSVKIIALHRHVSEIKFTCFYDRYRPYCWERMELVLCAPSNHHQCLWVYTYHRSRWILSRKRTYYEFQLFFWRKSLRVKNHHLGKCDVVKDENKNNLIFLVIVFSNICLLSQSSNQQ